MKKIFRTIKVCAFLTIFLLCLAVVSKILSYEHETEPDLTMKEFYSLKEDTVQVVAVGSSHVTLGFSPMEAYKQFKITSYNFGTNKQPIDLSYHLVKEALKTQSPQVVIYDVASLFYGGKDVNTARFRYIMDGMPLSLNKVELAFCAAKYNSTDEIFAVGEALCPIYYFHDRWKEIGEEEFNVDKSVSYLKGQFMRTYIKEIDYDYDKVEAKIANQISEGTAEEPTISEYYKSYLLKMKQVCDENGVKLLLMTTPTVRWNSLKADAIKKICKETGLDFLDQNMPDGELIDYSQHMADGNHVTAYGAKYTTKHFCEYIIENYGVEGKSNPEYEASMKYYDAYDNVLKYQLETDFTEYLELIDKNQKDLMVFVSAKNTTLNNLNDNQIKLLKDIGLEQLTDKSTNGMSYASFVQGIQGSLEIVGENSFSKKEKMDNGITVEISSTILGDADSSVIKVDGKDYSINSDGLNIVVYDMESKLVLDSVCFNTNLEDNHWYRGESQEPEKEMYINYRDWVLENY